VDLEVRATALRVVRFVEPGAAARQVALLWNAADAYETRGAFLDLEGVEERLGRNLETVDFGAPVRSVLPTGDPLRLLLLHGTGAAGVSLLDVADRTVQPLGVTLRGSAWAMHPDGRSLFVAADEGYGLSAFALATRHAETVRLDAAPARVFALPGYEDDRGVRRGEALLVDHGWASGYLTALPLAAPARAGASSIQGFLAEGLLDVDPGRYPGTEVQP
jgi:hypothetical protein